MFVIFWLNKKSLDAFKLWKNLSFTAVSRWSSTCHMTLIRITNQFSVFLLWNIKTLLLVQLNIMTKVTCFLSTSEEWQTVGDLIKPAKNIYRSYSTTEPWERNKKFLHKESLFLGALGFFTLSQLCIFPPQIVITVIQNILLFIFLKHFYIMLYCL